MKWLHEFARHPRKRRRGYRLAHRELKKKWATEGKRINAKRVHRLWRREGLSVPPRRRKRRIRGVAPARKVVADQPNSVWCFDFVEEKTIHGQKLRTFCVSDAFAHLQNEFTREALAIEVGTRFVSERVCQTLERLIQKRGAPGAFRMDNGRVQARLRRSSSPWRCAAYVIAGASIRLILIRESPGRMGLPKAFIPGFGMSLWMGRYSTG